jgi:hypothetical protein
MFKKLMLPLIFAVAAAVPGCDRVHPVAGGTRGMLRMGDELTSDIQVTVHQVDGGSTRPVGFGVTSLDGSFELVTNGAQGPLWLAPGEYRFTLESAGSPVRLPGEFARPDTTPLAVEWSADDGDLDLDASS